MYTNRQLAILKTMKTQTPKKRIPKNVRDAYAIVGRAGGKASFKKNGKDGMSEIGKKGAKARWKNHKKVDKSKTKKTTKRIVK